MPAASAVAEPEAEVIAPVPAADVAAADSAVDMAAAASGTDVAAAAPAGATVDAMGLESAAVVAVAEPATDVVATEPAADAGVAASAMGVAAATPATPATPAGDAVFEPAPEPVLAASEPALDAIASESGRGSAGSGFDRAVKVQPTGDEVEQEAAVTAEGGSASPGATEPDRQPALEQPSLR